MTIFFRKIRQKLITENKFIQYFLYAIGEIIIIIIGIFLAIQLNQYAENRSNKVKQCQYLNDLYTTLEQDSKFIENKIPILEKDKSNLKLLRKSIVEKTVNDLDSLSSKLFWASYSFDVFRQASKSKIEEIKYSNINLIKNDELRNKIMHYQDETIFTLRAEEENLTKNNNEIRQYFKDYIIGVWLGDRSSTIDKYKVLSNPTFLFLIVVQVQIDDGMIIMLKETLLKENEIIKNLIKEELKTYCRKR